MRNETPKSLPEKHIQYCGYVLRLLILLSVFVGNSPFSLAAEKKIPFHPGEKLTYELRWEFIPAGEAALEVLPTAVINKKKAFHFLLTAKTNSFADLFYKVRDRITAYTDVDMTHSLLYEKKQREGKTKRDVTVSFDWHKNKAIYADNGKMREPISLLPGSFDPLSAFYYTRMFDFSKIKEINRPITDGKKNVVGRLQVVKREKIYVKGLQYDTFLIVPELKHVGGVFEKSRDAKIELWVSADHRRIPIRIKSKVVVGSFIGELVADTSLNSIKTDTADTANKTTEK